MLQDAQNRFSVAQAITATAVSTNVIDLGIARDIGGAVTDQLYLLCQVVTAFTAGGSATLQVALQASTDNATFVILIQSDAIAVASLIQGYKFLQGPLPSVNSTTLYRYLRLNYTVATGPMTAGAITASLVPALQHSPPYSGGYLA